MKRSVVAFLTGSALAALLAFVSGWLAAGESAPPPTPAVGDASEGLEVRYARAYLQLAQTDLQIALQANAKVRGMFPESALQPLQHVVVIAQEQVNHALHQNAQSLHKVHIRQAELAVQDAEADLQRALAVNRRMPKLLTPTEIRQLRLRLKVARLALVRARAVDARNPLEHVQWQLDELRTDLLRLRSQMERLAIKG